MAFFETENKTAYMNLTFRFGFQTKAVRDYPIRTSPQRGR